MGAKKLRSMWQAGRARGLPAIAALLGAGALVVLGNDAAPVMTEPDPPARGSDPTAPAASVPTLSLDRLRREASPQGVADLFSGHSWLPAPAPPPPVVQAVPTAPAPAKPAGPPALPFAYIGKLDEEGSRTIYYLERGISVLTVVEGEVIGDYRFDAAKAGELAFTHLPTQGRQVLRLPE
ncbi:MAG: hypothetical protein OEY03_03015 [Rhizobacter sp.]|nr:hypothetical protein [Rhizobacter sp.]